MDTPRMLKDLAARAFSKKKYQGKQATHTAVAQKLFLALNDDFSRCRCFGAVQSGPAAGHTAARSHSWWHKRQQ
jgi:hypothetical protein